MAVANPGPNKEWEEWKREMKVNRKMKLWKRVRRWSKAEEEEKEDNGEEEEAEDTDCEEEQVSDVEESEVVDEEEEKEVKQAEELEEGEQGAEREVKENKRGDEEEDNDAKEAKEMQEEQKEGENKVEREVKEKEEVDDEEGEEVTELEEVEEEQGEVENEVNEEVDEEEDRQVREEEQVKEKEEVDAEEGKEVTESEEVEEEQGEVENEVNEEVDEEEDRQRREEEQVKEEEEVDAEERKEVTESEEVEEEQGEVENEVNEEVDEEEDRQVREEEQVKEKEEVDAEEGKEVTESEEVEEEQGEVENELNEEVDEEEDRQVREEEQVREDDDEEQQQIGQYHLEEQFRVQVKTEDQPSTSQEDKTVNETDSVESDNEDSDSTGSEDECCNFERLNEEERPVEKQCEDPEEPRYPDEKSWSVENSSPGEWTWSGDESEKLTDEQESWTTQEEEFQEDYGKLQEEEEEYTDEEAEHSADEDVGNNDEDVVKIYCKANYVTVVFNTLTEFRNSSLLTDLTLSTEDGNSFFVHSLVLAAVSSLIRGSLSRINVKNSRCDKRKDEGLRRWSLSLGPEVDNVGLEAVVEFAYTGLISFLNKDTVHQIKTAAQTLGAPRVLDLCTEEEEKSRKTGGQKTEGRISAAEQMMISLKSIKQLWMDRESCDVILEAIGGSLHIHRVILAVGSDYFRSMFTLGMRESHQSCVTLPFILASELELLIDCSYSGAIPLSWKCIFEITSTALQLQYQPALSLCLDFMHQEINPHSCLDVASFAEAYEMVQLLEVADDFVLRQFQKVACTSKFKDLPAKKLLKYLKSHSLYVPSEIVVFKAVVAWIQAKPKTRLRLTKDLMKTIHFHLMTFKEFHEVKSLNMWSDYSLEKLYETIFEEFCSNETDYSQCRIYLPKESLILIGGDQTCEDKGSRSISRELWFGNSLRNHLGIKKAMEWRKLGEMPDPARYSHEVSVLRGQLYVFGGKNYYGTNDILNSVYRYDPLQNSWERLAEMQEKRCSFSVVVLDEKIYAIGGYCEPDYLESVERYCPVANSWSFTSPLDMPLSAHVAKVFQGQIFVSGGLSNQYQCLASMFLYHPETGSTYLENMAKPRAYHCMETLGNCLYVAGGIATDTVDQLACEVYNPEADSWTAFTSLPVPHVGAGSAVLEEKFYVLGGYSREDFSDTKIVHRYDPTAQRWENMGKMPGPNNDIQAALLCLPSHFRL
ncbi:uncharacterized protein LOC127364664 isoform X2 [Dicentrarchus labrax]|uniref:uncharacterized protein LOC127364664 isoform X2 n=1 Tax=Dicentrarchus labrax TaxID=13489 RepID=UPI0021F69C99|nr:uncharacterized protein LOC127364664 isoform X2 [Dicentrarchus labrax]